MARRIRREDWSSRSPSSDYRTGRPTDRQRCAGVHFLERLIASTETPTRRIGRRVLIGRSAVESFAQTRSWDDPDPNEVSE